MPSPVQPLASSVPPARSAGPASTMPPRTSFRSLFSRTHRPAPADAGAGESRRAEARKLSGPARSRRADRNGGSRLPDEARGDEADGVDDVKRTKKRPDPSDAPDETAAADAASIRPAETGDDLVSPDGTFDHDDGAAYAAAAAQQEPVAVVPTDANVESDGTDAVAGGLAAPLNRIANVGGGVEDENNIEGSDASDASADTGFALPTGLLADAEGEAPDGQTPAPPRPAATRAQGLGFGTGGIGQPSPNAPAEADLEAKAAGGAAGVDLPDAALADELAQPGTVAPNASGEAQASKPANDRTEGLPPPPPDLSSNAPAARQAAQPATASEVPPEARFAALNHDKVVTAVRAELLPGGGGGSMQIRLDPPELGDMLVSIQIRDGVVTAAFQTTNEKASTLLSHSLTNLKASLEAQGVSVDRLHVQQTPKDSADAGHGGQQGGSHQHALEDRESGRREQQRKEMVQRMWQKLMGGGDPLDLIA